MTLTLLFLFWSMSTPSGATPIAAGAPFFLEPGEQRSVRVPGLIRFSVSGDSIRHHRIPGTERILLKAVKPGVGTLYLEAGADRHRTHLIRVESPKTPTFPPDLLRALNHLNQTEVLQSAKQLILKGEVSEFSEAEAIRNLRDAFPSWIVDDTRIELRWLESCLVALRRWIEPFPALRIRSGEGMIRVEGSVPGESDKEILTRKIRNLQPLTQIQIASGKDADPTLHFKVFLLETRKDLGQTLGADWSVPFSGRNPPGPLDLTLRALSERGELRILSSPEISVKSPGKAELFAGGEIPIRQRTRFNETVQWKTVGLSLKLEVLEYREDSVRLNVETEMSHLATDLQNDNIPGLRSNRIRTEVAGHLDRPVLLSGLIQEDLRETAKGLPGLHLLPALGALFGSRDYLERKSELSAVLLPQRGSAPAPMRSIDLSAPMGWIPPSRNRISMMDLEQLKKEADFPWNML